MLLESSMEKVKFFYRVMAIEKRIGNNVNMNTFIHRHFTLIELLVVVSIIAILTSLLLPALSTAREKAREISCVGNVKQIGVGIFNYIDDSDGFFPSYNLGGEAATQMWYSNIDEKMRNVVPTSRTIEGEPPVWVCPANKKPGWNYNTLSYGYNRNIGNFNREGIPATASFGNPVLRVSMIKSPPKVILIGDGDGNQEWDAVIESNYYTVGDRHRRGSNIGYVDGHVNWMLQSDTFRPGVTWDGIRWSGGAWGSAATSPITQMWGHWGGWQY